MEVQISGRKARQTEGRVSTEALRRVHMALLKKQQ